MPHEDSATMAAMARRSRPSAVLKDIMVHSKLKLLRVWEFVIRALFILFWVCDPPLFKMLTPLLMSSEQTWHALAEFWEWAGLHNFSLMDWEFESYITVKFWISSRGVLFCWQKESGKSQNCTTKLKKIKINKVEQTSQLKKSMKTVSVGGEILTIQYRLFYSVLAFSVFFVEL